MLVTFFCLGFWLSSLARSKRLFEVLDNVVNVFRAN